jgi:hypothetical protein
VGPRNATNVVDWFEPSIAHPSQHEIQSSERVNSGCLPD